jgi:hypothetical protein
MDYTSPQYKTAFNRHLSEVSLVKAGWADAGLFDDTMPAIILLAETDSEKLKPSSRASNLVAPPLSFTKVAPANGAVSDRARADINAIPAGERVPESDPAVLTPRRENVPALFSRA